MWKVPRFFPALRKVRGRAFTGTCFRVVELEAFVSATPHQLLFDRGPEVSIAGQRFSPPGDHRGLYVSEQKETAGSEFADGWSAWKAGDCAKHETFDMEVKLASVLDLTDAGVRRALKISKKETMSAWLGFDRLNGGKWPPTWSLGAEAFASGRFDGIRFNSTKRVTGSCLLIFTERLVFRRTHVIIHREDGSLWEQLP